MAENSSDSCQCSLQQCGEIIDTQDTKIEVCTKLPASWKSSSSKKQQQSFLVAWNTKGGAQFHLECWQKLLKSARAYTVKKSALKLEQTEKNMVKEAAKTCERHDGLTTVQQEAKRIADMIKKSKHFCAFTGAGISTSAGIGDYRGKSGKWTEEERQRTAVDVEEPPSKKPRVSEEPTSKKRRVSEQDTAESDGSSDESEAEDDWVPYEKLRPTYTHEALAKLHELGHLKYVISQNCDGLHILSGLSEDSLSELHGNVFMEKCESCDARYHRDFYVMDDVASQYYEELEDNGKTTIRKPKHAAKCELCGLCHRTGRRCGARLASGKKKCNGYLKDTIINFRDHLEDAILDRAYANAEKCDVMLCLGTTLQVTPANELVEVSQVSPHRLVIINRQKTDVDKVCTKPDKSGNPVGSRVFGDCDVVLREVMKHLLSQNALRTWEAGRKDRMTSYDRQRKDS